MELKVVVICNDTAAGKSNIPRPGIIKGRRRRGTSRLRSSGRYYSKPSVIQRHFWRKRYCQLHTWHDMQRKGGGGTLSVAVCDCCCDVHLCLLAVSGQDFGR